MKKVLLEAPILTQSGYGEHSRLVFESIRSLENLNIHINPLTWGKTSWSQEYASQEIQENINSFREYVSKKQQEKKNPEYDIQIFIGIPNQFEKRAPYSVCVTAGIETDRVSANWIFKTYQGIDKLVVPSQHAKDSFVRTNYEVINNKTNTKTEVSCNCDVDVVPYPVKDIDSDDINLELETDFNFLNVALLGPRKNLENSIEWFIKEFKNDPNVGLVLKTGQSAGSVIDREITKNHLKNVLDKHKDRKCKVYLLHGSMSEKEIHSLYKHPKIKAFATATHAEGFGLPIFEAVYSGMPVIATDWSGHLDFLTGEIKQKKTGKLKEKKLFAKVDYDLKEIHSSAVWPGVLEEGSKWAYPNELSYRKQLKNVKNNYGMYKKWAQSLQERVIKTHSMENTLSNMRLAILGKELVDQSLPAKIEDLPKVSIITSVYNGEKYIEQFLEDITRQTIFKQKCELILVNANSPQKAEEEKIITRYKEAYPENIKYFVLDEDPGIYGTWNFAISKATGDLITNANLDDRKKANSLEVHAGALLKDTEVDLVYSDMLVTEKINETWENNSSEGKKYTMPEFSLESLKMMNMPHAAPMWRKTVHDKYGLFDVEYRSAGDWEMWLRAAAQGSKFKKINGSYNLYCFNPEGVSTNPENFSWKHKEERKVFEKYSEF